jgi:tetratricopeptide (TPR) repeat protein
MKTSSNLVLLVIILPSLFAISAASAQTKVSFSASGTPAHDCYVSALTLVKTGSHLAIDGISTCDAALQAPIGALDRAATFNNRGILHNAEQNFPAAWADFDASIKLNPDLGDAWLNRGTALIRMHRLEEALPDIEHAVALGPSMPQIGYFDLGIAHQSLGHVADAYAAYKRALSIDPDFTPATDALKNFRVVPARGG